MALRSDHCPYQRPFPPGFVECPVFEAETWVPLDSHFQPLQPKQSCRHLEIGREDGAYYPRCALGDATERRLHAETPPVGETA